MKENTDDWQYRAHCDWCGDDVYSMSQQPGVVLCGPCAIGPDPHKYEAPKEKKDPPGCQRCGRDHWDAVHRREIA